MFRAGRVVSGARNRMFSCRLWPANMVLKVIRNFGTHLMFIPDTVVRGQVSHRPSRINLNPSVIWRLMIYTSTVYSYDLTDKNEEQALME